MYMHICMRDGLFSLANEDKKNLKKQRDRATMWKETVFFRSRRENSDDSMKVRALSVDEYRRVSFKKKKKKRVRELVDLEIGQCHAKDNSTFY